MDEHRPAYVDALLRPEAYVHENVRPAAVELVETHVSYLFLTGETVYKVKKAVDLGFLDFTALETREYYCWEELRLNRRFSPSVYRDVVPVTQGADGIALNGSGQVIDYAVKMRQLPREQMLDARLRAGSVSREDVVRIARRIAQAHREAERSADPAGEGSWVAFRHHVEENISQTARAADRLVERDVLEDITAYSRAFLEGRRELFDRRQAAGRVVDGHGDLHAGQICLNNGIEFIDCLEFSPAYRCGDVAADLAFPAMDLDHFGRRDLSEVLVEAYVEASGDEGVRALLGFFKAYRAHVRAKVTMLKLDAPGLSDEERGRAEADCRSYFALARSYALEALPSPGLYVVMGLPGTGKSTVARGLAARWGLPVYSSDVERKRLMGMEPTDRGGAAPGQGIYRASVGRRTYERLFELAEAELQAGRSVVLDATFGHPPYRERAAQIADRFHAGLWFVECALPPGEVHRRIEARISEGVDPSDAGIAVYETQRRAWRPVGPELAGRRLIRVDTRASPDAAVSGMIYGLFERSV